MQFESTLYAICEYVDNTTPSRAGYQMTWNSREIVYWQSSTSD